MSNLRLPTNGDTNWGSALNSYLENLNAKVQSLSQQYANLDNNSAIKNVGYASSGVVGRKSCTYSNKVITFTGDVFVSGDVNTYFTNINCSKQVGTMKTGQTYFVLLQYNTSSSTFDILIDENKLSFNYYSILIGFYYTDKDIFVPYYHSSLKTIMQIQQEMYNRWSDLESYNSTFIIGIKDKKPNTASCGKYGLYCGGIGDKISTSKFYSDLNAPLELIPTGNILFLYDVVDNSNKLKTVAGEGSLGEGNVYRILLDIFGNTIIQKNYSTALLQGNGYWREQQLLNARFNNDLPSAFNASLWTEVLRFGYNLSDIEDIVYTQDYEYNDDRYKDMYSDMTIVKSIVNGLASQQSPYIWVTKDSEIHLDHTTFVDGNMGFVLDYTGNSASNPDTISIDKTKATSNKLLFAKSSEDVAFNNINIAEGGVLQYTSDRRCKDNFETIEDKYLDVVSNVPVLRFNYKNSDEQHVGIVAQDLENTNISDINAFITIHQADGLKDKRLLHETKLIYILWKALQEETELRKKLENRVADLERNL